MQRPVSTSTNHHSQKSRIAALCLCLLGGCAVGPKYDLPASPTAPAYKESAAVELWQPAQPLDAALKGKWWEMFDEPELDALESRLNVDNQNIAQSFQNFLAARAQVREARAGYFPTVALSPAYTRAHAGATAAGAGSGAGATSGGTTSSYLLPIDASWEPDLWGRVRNTVSEFRAAAQVSAADLENTRLMEQAALATFFFELRGQDSLQDLYDRAIEADRRAVELTRVLYETGIDNDEDVATAELTLADAEEAGAGIATNRALYEHAIATLIGTPASLFSMPVKLLSTNAPPIPVGVPSQLLQRRPDIAAAERAMAQANALIRVETAAYFPTMTLTGSAGYQSSALSRLLSAPALFWSLGASAAETIFDGGLRSATVTQYTASYNASVATYRQAVLTAFEQVEDGMATLRVTSQQIGKEDAAVRAAQRFLDIATVRYETGLDPYLDVIAAQTALLTDQQTLIALHVSDMTAAVQLIQALGGGWSVKEDQP
jgi:NodT family efflux transporter outer membrane factor (OMF) lipoprotein